jgi:flagellar basal-body rod modification protein FlgD
MIDAIAATQSNQNPRSANLASQSEKGGSYMQMEDFLQLLTSQISNQDPLEPMKDTEFISQMANIASLEQMQQFTQGFESFADSQKDMVAQAYLGRMVSISKEGSVVSGLVESVEKAEDGTISVTVSGKNYDPQSITRVSLPNNG